MGYRKTKPNHHRSEKKNKENLLFDQRLASFESILETQSSYHMNQIQAKLNSFAEVCVCVFYFWPDYL